MEKPLKSVTHGQCDAGPTVTSPAAGHHRPLTGTKVRYTAWWYNLPKVVNWKRNGRDSNPRPFESQIQRANHYATRPYAITHRTTNCYRSGSIDASSALIDPSYSSGGVNVHQRGYFSPPESISIGSSIFKLVILLASLWPGSAVGQLCVSVCLDGNFWRNIPWSKRFALGLIKTPSWSNY